MTIKVGDTLPAMKLVTATPEGPKETSTEALFNGKRVVMFAVPGAFTPTCSARHVPGYLKHHQEIMDKGVDTLVCMAVNDPFVLRAWAADQDLDGKIVMLADGAGVLTRAMGLELDLTARSIGIRCQRFAMIAEDMKVTYLAVEAPGDFDVSRAEALLAAL